MILLGPIKRTVIPCGYHDLRGTCLDVAHCTWHVVIVKAALEWIKRANLILSTIHEGGGLKTFLVLVVLWFVWQAKVLTTTTRWCSSCFQQILIDKKKFQVMRNFNLLGS